MKKKKKFSILWCVLEKSVSTGSILCIITFLWAVWGQKWEQERQCTYKCNTGARSCYCCCHGRASITYSECVSVALVIQHKTHMPCILLYSVACPALPHIPHIISQSAQFSEKKKVTEHKMCVLIFSRTFLILGRIQRHNAINIQMPYVKYPLFISKFNGTWILSTGFQKIIK